VFAASPTAVSFTVSVQYWIDNDQSPNETSIQAAVTAAVNTWVRNITDKIGRSINGSQLTSAMIGAGASRVVIVSPTDSVLLRYQIGVLSGTPTITFEGLESDNWS
jgi:phage-related baseplate assembly protein